MRGLTFMSAPAEHRPDHPEDTGMNHTNPLGKELESKDARAVPGHRKQTKAPM